MKQYQGNFEPKAHGPNTTFTTSTNRQPKASNTPKSCKTASQKAGTATYTDNMSPIQTSFRTTPPPKTSAHGTIPTPKLNTAHSTRRPASRTHQLHSHSEPQTCCMHVHQQQSQTYKTGEPSALREVKHPHRDRTSVSRSPSTEQEVLSQFSGYSEEIEHFTRDPYKSHLKSCLQSTEHASKVQEVNTCINCEHSYRHMNDHPTQNTGRMQRQHLQRFSHAEFLPGMENTPAFLGKQFLQGKEEITCPDMENIPVPLWNQSIQGNEKMWIHVHLYQEALHSAQPHTQGEFHRISNNWRRKVPTQWHFQASTTMLIQPHM